MFAIPNEVDSFNAKQSELDAVDITIFSTAMRGSGIISGFGGEVAVTALATPGLAVQVASGTLKYDRTWTDVSAVTSFGISAADSLNPRFDLAYVNNVGSFGIQAGVAASAPVFPAIPSSSVALAALYIPANATVCSPGQIIDKRFTVRAPVESIAIVCGSGQAWAVPAAFTEFGGTARNRVQLQLIHFSQWRLQATMISSLGAAATRMGVNYSPQLNAFTNSWFGLDNNTGAAISSFQCHADSFTTLTSSWAPICDSAWLASEVLLRVVANSGAAQNAWFGSLYLQLR